MPQPRILVVEDSLLIAMEVAALVQRCGCAVAGPIGSVGEALKLARRMALDGAVLDINLGTDRVWPVAELLMQRGVPFVLTTGYDRMEIPERFRAAPLLSKPIALDSLGKALRQLEAIP